MNDFLTTLEMSQRLKDAGFRADTQFYRLQSGNVLQASDGANEKTMSIVPSYLFQQLWEALPDTILFEENRTNGKLWHKKLERLDGLTSVSYRLGEVLGIGEIPFGDHLPDTAGEAVLWCIKQGYILTNKHEN